MTAHAKATGKLNLYTIGVYGKSEAEFFDELAANRVNLFVDIRARRGVRGAEYAFVNSARLQARLTELGIDYHHASELATPDALRAAESERDKRTGVGQRSRERLSREFVTDFKRVVLTADNLAPLLEQIEIVRSNRKSLSLCLFCVEAKPEACHRSLVAEALGKRLGVMPVHL